MRDAERPVLERLDDRVVPYLQRGARRLGRAFTTPFRALNRVEERAGGGAAFRALWPRRQLIVLAAAVLLFVGAFVHMQRFETARGDAPAAAPGVSDPGGADDGPAVAGAGATTVGPTIGAAIDDHIAERQAELDAAEEGEQRFAVVSFTTYVDADTAAEIIDDDVLEAQLRVPSEGEDPFRVEVADDDLAAAVAAELERERERIADEEEEFRRLLDSDTIEDPEFEEFYEAEVERLAGIRNLLDAGSGTVFAVVLEASVSELRALAAHEGVRLVDLAPAEVSSPDDVTFYGLLPDESSTASFGSLG